jgi:hypothetical protein
LEIVRNCGRLAIFPAAVMPLLEVRRQLSPFFECARHAQLRLLRSRGVGAQRGLGNDAPCCSIFSHRYLNFPSSQTLMPMSSGVHQQDLRILLRQSVITASHRLAVGMNASHPGHSNYLLMDRKYPTSCGGACKEKSESGRSCQFNPPNWAAIVERTFQLNESRSVARENPNVRVCGLLPQERSH